MLTAFATTLAEMTRILLFLVVFPASYGQDCKTGASIVLLSCAGSILTVPVLYAIVQVLFG